jgi:uncharacterized Zn finger protein (UPF0148 family)
MVMMEGGCDKCGMFAYVGVEKFHENNGKILCISCEEKYYSLQSVRDVKLSSLLKKRFWIF